MSAPKELRKVVGDTVYTLEHAPYGMWLLKGNGVALGYPCSREYGEESFRAVTAR